MYDRVKGRRDPAAVLPVPIDWPLMSTRANDPAEVARPATGLLDGLRGPDDLRHLTPEELNHLAAEIRDFLVEKVARTGGHLGPNLGVVELTLALHRVFDSPEGPVALRHRPSGVRP